MGYRNAFSAKTESLGDDGAVVSAGEMRFCGLPWRSTENVASLAFRAEDVQLAASGIPAEVAQVEYCGQLWLADLRLADRSEEHTSALQSLLRISYAVFCLKKIN